MAPRTQHGCGTEVMRLNPPAVAIAAAVIIRGLQQDSFDHGRALLCAPAPPPDLFLCALHAYARTVHYNWYTPGTARGAGLGQYTEHGVSVATA